MQNMRNSISQKIIKAQKTDMDIRRNDIRGNRAEGNDNAGKADIAVAGLAVMGANLALNMESKGFHVAVYNRTEEKLEEFMVHRAQGRNFIPARSPEELCPLLKRPRRIMMMVKAGAPVDELIARFLPALEPGDILIDGGNSHFTDTERRCRELAGKGIRYLGVGISGGEEGALHGPSIMPGGNGEAWPYVRDLFRAIAARAGGKPCCEWIGTGGAGHFVKMLHNGIEYADMQLISEAYFILKTCNAFSNDQIAQFFEECGRGALGGYLIEITAQILKAKDGSGKWIVDSILDTASQKGTGKWTVEAALDLQRSIPSIAAAVFARFASADKAGRVEARKAFPKPSAVSAAPSADSVRAALYASKILAYSQGFSLMEKASEQFGWNLDFASIASIWRNGCIIRSVMLDKISAAYKRQKSENFIFDDYFKSELVQNMPRLREVVAAAALNSACAQAFFASLAYFDAAVSDESGANLVQAQRDFFGAHTYERVDSPRGMFFHTDWSAAAASEKNQIQRVSK